MSTISRDGRYVQLWDLLTDVPAGATSLTERCERRRELGDRVKNRLNEAARVWGQEIRLFAEKDGWELELFSCFDEEERTILSVFVPADKNSPIVVRAPGEKVEVVREEAQWIKPK